MFSNKIITSALLTLTAAAVLTSCDFEENCPSRGYIKAYVKNDSPDISPRGWQDRNLLYFPYTDVKEQGFLTGGDVFKADTLIREVPTGSYDLLLYNRGTNISVPAGDNIADHFVLRCPVERINGRDVITKEQVFVTSGVLRNVRISQWQNTDAPFVMRPLVKKISLIIEVTDNTPDSHIRSVQCYLDGVVSSKNVATLVNGSDFAVQRFQAVQSSDKENVFEKSLWVFGLNRSVSNLLHLTGTDENGKDYDTSVDISDPTGKMDDDGTGGVTIHIKVQFHGSLSAGGIAIVDWHDVIQPSGILGRKS